MVCAGRKERKRGRKRRGKEKRKKKEREGKEWEGHEDFAKFEAQLRVTRYKFGVLYCDDNQTDENDIYSNGMCRKRKEKGKEKEMGKERETKGKGSNEKETKIRGAAARDEV
jgi:hypothetical protein